MKDFAPTLPLPPVPVPCASPPELVSGGGGGGANVVVTPERDREAMDQEKRLRREIANSNERRRMQSINAGFQSLRNLLPHHEGEKLSKAAILQQTAEYIHQLEQEKSRLMAQNSQLMKRFNSNSSSSNNNNNNSNTTSGTTTTTTTGASSGNPSGDAPSASSSVFSSPHSPSTGETPPAIIKRRKTLDGSVESADEGIGSMSPDHNGEEYRNEVAELRRETMGLRIQLDRERRHRLSLEDTLSGMRQHNQQQQHQDHEQQQQHQQEQQQHQQEQQQHHQQQQQQIIEPQIVYVQHEPAPPPPPPPPPSQQQQQEEEEQQQQHQQIKYEHERMQTAEENEVYHRVSTPARNSYDDYRVRHNLNSIVEAIRQLEGDHLFADDRSPARRSVSPPTASPPRAMEICSSSGNSSEYMSPVAQVTTVRPPWSAPCQPPSYKPVAVSDKPLALTTFTVAPSSEPVQVHPAVPYHQTSVTVVPVSTTVTSLKHHVLNRLARSNELEEQPINLEYRPVISRSPSPPPQQQHHQHQHHLHHHVQHHLHPQIAHQQPPQQTTLSQFHLQQQQLRPGVIVVKHS